MPVAESITPKQLNSILSGHSTKQGRSESSSLPLFERNRCGVGRPLVLSLTLAGGSLYTNQGKFKQNQHKGPDFDRVQLGQHLTVVP